MHTKISRAFGPLVCISAAVLFALCYNANSDHYMIGFDLQSSIIVGLVIGAIIGGIAVLTEIVSRDRLQGTWYLLVVGPVSGFLIYAGNCFGHMNAGWSQHGVLISLFLGLVCGGAFAAGSGIVKRPVV